MYNTHRGLMQPPHAPPASRITDLLEQIRMEFENQANQLNQAGQSREYDQQREHMIRQQVQEMEMMRDRVHQLETTHAQMKQDWEKQIDTLKRELEMRGGHAQQPRHPAPHQPPSIGHGPRDLFGQIMAGGGTQSSALAPPQQAPEQATGLPVHLNQGAGLNTGPQHPQHQPYPGAYPGAGVNGYAGQQPPPLNPSPGPGKPARRPPPGGGSTPQQNAPMPYPQSPRGHGPTPPPARHAQPPPPATVQALQNIGNELGLLKLEELPADLKKQGDDWWAVFNPSIQRQLDVSLVHTLHHSSVVCCVRFSLDGNYVATGCNRVAQIFDVHTGKSVATLEDETGDNEGDLYIRSVCFSPDGTYLATGAEDKCIRVWDIGAGRIVHTFVGHEQDIYSLDFSRNGQLIASGSGDRTVKLWDLKAKEERVTLVIEEGVTTVALSPDGRLVAAGSLDRSVRVWDTETGMRIESLEGTPSAGHGDSVYSVAFSPTGRELVSGSLDRTIKMWELSSSAPRDARGQQPKGLGRCIRTFEGHSDFVLSVALTPDGDWVLSGSKDRGVVFWDPHSGIPQLHLQGHKNSVISVAPSPKPGLFATGSGDSRARIWRYEPYRGP